MATNDFRNPDARQRTKKTIRISGGSSTTRIYGDNNSGKVGAGVKDSQRWFKPAGDVSGYSYDKNGQFGISDDGQNFKLYNGGEATWVKDSTRLGGNEYGGYLEVKIKNPDSFKDVYGMKVGDDRFGLTDEDQKNSKVQNNRKGRNKLKIALKGDASAGRLKQGTQSPKDKRVGVQGGSLIGNGINIPR